VVPTTVFSRLSAHPRGELPSPAVATSVLLIALLFLLAGCTASTRWCLNCDDDDAFTADDDSADDDDSASGDDDSAGDDDDSTPLDSDGDGSPDEDDCAPGNPLIHPLAEEICDGLDTDCDGELGNGQDGTPDELDTDGDGVSICAGDCDDLEATTYPGASDGCDGIDSDCDGFAEDSPSGDPQEMFIIDWGHLYVTILSVDAGCDIYLAMDAPVVIADMVGEVHAATGTEVDVGQVLPCTAMRFTSTSCSSQFSTLDPAAFQITPLPANPNHWLLEHEDGFDNDYNDVVFEALVETRE